MKTIKLTVIKLFGNTPININPAHIVSMEALGEETEVIVYTGERYVVKQSEEEIRKLIADLEAKPVPPEVPKPIPPAAAALVALLLFLGFGARAQMPPPMTNTLHIQMIGYQTNSFGVFTNADVDNKFDCTVVTYVDGTMVQDGNANTNFVEHVWNNDIGWIWFAHCSWDKFTNCVTVVTNIYGGYSPLFLYLTNAPGITVDYLNGSTNLSSVTNLPVVMNCEVTPELTQTYEVKAPTNLAPGATLLYSYLLNTNKWHVNANPQYYGSSVVWGESLGPNFWKTSNSTYAPAWRLRWYQSGHWILTNQSANW